MVVVLNLVVIGGVIINYLCYEMCCVDMVIGVFYKFDLQKIKCVLCEMLEKDFCIFKDLDMIIGVLMLVDLLINFVVCLWCKILDYWVVYFDLM